MLKLGSSFTGYAIEATDGNVGTVSDLLFDDKSWAVRWLVVDTGTWLTGRKILIHPAAISHIDIPGRALPVNLTREQVKGSPDIGQDEPVSRHMERRVYGYYGYDPLSGAGYSGGYANGDSGVLAEQESGMNGDGTQPAKSDPHLRSLAEISGYTISATDGEIGHLESCLLDDTTWVLTYLVVDTSNWWMGKKVLVAPSAIKAISWAERFLRLDLTCYKIKGSPPWHEGGLIDRAYEQVLRAYYGWAPTEVQAAPAAAAKVEQPEHAH